MLVVVIGISTLIQRRKWFKKAATGQALIVDRTLVQSEDQYGVVTDYHYELALKIDHHPSRSDFSDQVVRMVVSERIYEEYADEVVRVYYSGTDPLEFFIKGE